MPEECTQAGDDVENQLKVAARRCSMSEERAGQLEIELDTLRRQLWASTLGKSSEPELAAILARRRRISEGEGPDGAELAVFDLAMCDSDDETVTSDTADLPVEMASSTSRPQWHDGSDQCSAAFIAGPLPASFSQSTILGGTSASQATLPDALLLSPSQTTLDSAFDQTIARE
jgi:hypothetical protein